ncbi:magnesium transporter MgtE [Methanofollis aquaemaris]|uniref:Magnesium transporter MgtE n=1 Tax=Methanofollis aquaemaris TaxID=126734 RepID=A0A8A3S100_9EURY|nr:magnesium transporter [Methanofollis aquaemaris]QSZ66075.1 magnesium transporter MgtE [Methanofollis aquaemaris]
MRLGNGLGREERLFLTGFLALLVSTAIAVVAGSYLSSIRETLALLPGLLVLVPPTINMRGSISGVLASRLSSSMHLGEFAPDCRGGVLAENLHASFILTVATAIALGFIAKLAAWAFGIEVIPAGDLVLISVIAGILSGLIVMGFTVLVSVLSYRRGVDMDMIAAPAVTTLGDLVTIPVLAVTAVTVTALPMGWRMALLALVLVVAAVATVYSWMHGARAREIVSEILPLLVGLSVLGTIAGVTYTMDLDRLVSVGALLILIPPFAGICGSIGGILCSRLGTWMHLGLIGPSIRPSRAVGMQFVQSYLFTLILLPLMAALAHGAALLLGATSPGLLTMVGIAVGAGVVVMSIVNGIAYLTASISFRYGFDPDNFGIPVITSVIDLLGAVVLISVINLLL